MLPCAAPSGTLSAKSLQWKVDDVLHMWYVKLAYEFHAIGFSFIGKQTAAQKLKLLREVIRHTRTVVYQQWLERKNLSQSSFAYLGQDLFFHKYKAIKDACNVCCFTDNGHNIDHFHQGSLLSMCFTGNWSSAVQQGWNHHWTLMNMTTSKMAVVGPSKRQVWRWLFLWWQDRLRQTEVVWWVRSQVVMNLNMSFLTSQDLSYICIVDRLSTRTGLNFTNEAVMYVALAIFGSHWTKDAIRHPRKKTATAQNETFGI